MYIIIENIKIYKIIKYIKLFWMSKEEAFKFLYDWSP